MCVCAVSVGTFKSGQSLDGKLMLMWLFEYKITLEQIPTGHSLPVGAHKLHFINMQMLTLFQN